MQICGRTGCAETVSAPFKGAARVVGHSLSYPIFKPKPTAAVCAAPDPVREANPAETLRKLALAAPVIRLASVQGLAD